MISCLTYLWYIGANGSMINTRHTKHHGRSMRSNKVEDSVAASLY